MSQGFGIYYVNDNDEIEVINFDVISSFLAENAETTVRGFRFLREQEFFKKIEMPNYIVWADCGTHFRNKLLIGYLFKELQRENIQGK